MTLSPPAGAEQRRGARIDCQLRVRIIGVDEDGGARAGNLSASGVFFETAAELADVGTIERLELATSSGELTVTTAAVLVRVNKEKDFWLGERSCGAAFQFLPDSDAVREGLNRLVRAAAQRQVIEERQHLQTGRLDATATAEGGPAKAVSVTTVGRDGMVLFTAWPVAPGAAIALNIAPPGQEETVQVRGVVRRSEAVDQAERFRLDVEVEPAGGESPGGDGLEEAVSRLLDAMVVPGQRHALKASEQAMVGSLARVPLTSLLSFLEWEEWSGALRLAQGDDQATLYLRDGLLIDVDWQTDTTDRRERLRRLLAWQDADFSLSVGSAPREDQFKAPIRALLMDLFREADEAQR